MRRAVSRNARSVGTPRLDRDDDEPEISTKYESPGLQDEPPRDRVDVDPDELRTDGGREW